MNQTCSALAVVCREYELPALKREVEQLRARVHELQHMIDEIASVHMLIRCKQCKKYYGFKSFLKIHGGVCSHCVLDYDGLRIIH